MLLDSGADVNAQTKFGATPLICASEHGYVEIVQRLLEAKADITLRCEDDNTTCLHWASSNGHASVVKLLLNAGADVNAIDEWGWTPLHRAIEKGSIDIVKSMLEVAGVDVNIADNYGWNPLCLAADYGRTEIAKMLVKANADISAQTAYGWNPLHIGSYKGHIDIVKFILRAMSEGADPSGDRQTAELDDTVTSQSVKEFDQPNTRHIPADVADKFGRSSVLIAAISGQTEVLKILLDSGADPKFVSDDGLEMTALHIAAQHGQLAYMDALIKVDPELVNAHDSYGRTPLHYAIEYGQAEAVKVLLNIETEDAMQVRNGWTALNLASRNGHAEVVNVLLDAKAKVGAEGSNDAEKRMEALLLAVQKDHVEVVKIFIKGHEELIEHQHSSGETLLHIAARADAERTVRWLLSCDAKCEAVNFVGDEPLWVAALAGNIRTTELLWNATLKVATANNFGRTRLHSAAYIGRIEDVQLLLQAGQIEVNTPDWIGFTALHFAAAAKEGSIPNKVLLESQKEESSMVSTLINAGADVHSRHNPQGWTPLHVAADVGGSDTVRYLLASGADLTLRDCDGRTPLDLAARRGHISVVKTLFSHIHDHNLYRDCNPSSSLIEAVLSRSVEIVRLFLEENRGGVKAVNNDGDTNLHIAVRLGLTEAVNMLLEAGADINAKTRDDLTALHLAVRDRQEQVLVLLLKWRADVAATFCGYSALHLGVIIGWRSGVRKLILSGADINAVTSDGYTVMNLAKANGDVKMMTLLRASPLLLANRSQSSEGSDMPIETRIGEVHGQ